MSAIDYAEVYDAYWKRPDRAGTSSFADAEKVAEQVLSACGGGRLLDVGCGMGELVRAVLAQGVNAVGMDVAAGAVAELNLSLPGRFITGDLLSPPFGDGEFDTVVCMDVLEHLAEEDVPRAIASLHRLTRRFAFLTIATRADRDGRWHLTVRERAWWEQRCLEAGFRRHPLFLRVTPYATLERDDGHCTLVLEKLPEGAPEAYPLSALAERRGLHMDMLRETGRRADAHAARYDLAAQFVRRGDRVLDAGCGLGYGSWILSRGSGAANVLGVDEHADAIGYARANFAESGGRIEFREGDAGDLADLPDASVDVITCFEALEHVGRPEHVLAEFDRLLTPGGRLVVSVPNLWTDESGVDPNPHHRTVYDWTRLIGQLSERFQIERAYAQIAGGGMKHTERPRSLQEVAVGEQASTEAPAADAEWWVVVTMKTPVGAEAVPYVETAFPAGPAGADYNVTAFARDYDNPWLFRGLVHMGMRCSNAALLVRLAEQALGRARAGSADEGAALCVLAYQRLARDEAPTPKLTARIERYIEGTEGSPHVWRWRISNRFALGMLRLRSGDRAGALAAFEACAAMDARRFSPLLATKTTEAGFMSGLLRACDGDMKGARRNWHAAVLCARDALSGDWSDLWGDADLPMTFALPEAAQVLDTAARCAEALHALQTWESRPGRAWTATRNDPRRWAASLFSAKAWLEQELAARVSDMLRHASQIGELRKFADDQRRGNAWLSEQRDRWQTIAQQHADAVARDRERAGAMLTEKQRAITDLRSHVEAVARARDWHQGQAENWKAAADAQRLRTEDCLREVERLKGWAEHLQAGLDWHKGQSEAAAGENTRLVEWTAELERAKNALAAEGERLKSALELGERQAAAQSREFESLRASLREVREELARLRTARGLARESVKLVLGPRNRNGAHTPERRN